MSQSFEDQQLCFDADFKQLVQRQNVAHRIKERLIEDAVYLVLRWRQLSEQKNDRKITLKEGADIVGVAKKSLDDYLLQLRLGRKYGFDFHKHGNSKIGILRSFNKLMKRKSKQGKFLPGRKRKEEEEDYSEMIKNIILDIHAPKTQKVVDEGLKIEPIDSKELTTSFENLKKVETNGTGSGSGSFEQKSLRNSFNWTSSMNPVNLDIQNYSFNFDDDAPNNCFNELDQSYSYAYFDHFADSFYE